MSKEKGRKQEQQQLEGQHNQRRQRDTAEIEGKLGRGDVPKRTRKSSNHTVTKTATNTDSETEKTLDVRHKEM